MKDRVEILAPAGSMECLKAAITAGADAVYTGGALFGARAYAHNLTEEELLEAIDYVHLHGRRLYLTVNTLIKDREMEKQMYDYLLPYYRQGLDAVIVQDIGLFRFIRKHFPDLPIHASTQMTLTGVDGAKFLEKEGSSNCDGVIVFDGLDPGIYLMIQRADFVYGGYTYSSAPAVIKIPSHIGDKDYMNVELEPKFTRSSESRGDKPTAPEETNPSETKPDRPSSGHHSSDGSTKPHTTPESSRPDIPTESTSSTESAPSDPEETLPDIPTESSEPSTETPKTGDDSPIGVYVVVMEVSLLVIIGLVILIKKREKDEKHEEK